ncbi:c-type cytochrome [Mesobacillus harenae]|uniref:c-type cytochrome n=1 Tax=Mesobacillus harenae TaxID=2213203 RepID=UPI00157FFE6E|nr:c-type cytochrome [Mesobacillus harenae]
MRRIVIGFAAVVLIGAAAAVFFSKNNAQLSVEVQEGEKLYRQHCVSCHGLTGQGEGAHSGTSLNNQQFLNSVSDEDLFNYVKYGRVKAMMPEYESILADEEIKKVVVFMRGWQSEQLELEAPAVLDGNPTTGERLYNLYCLTCHGESGQGINKMGTALANGDYLKYTTDKQIWISTAYGRENTRMGPSLKGQDGVRQLSEQDITDIVSFLRSFETNQ